MLAATTRTLKFLLVSALAAAIIAFSVVNREIVTVSLFPFPYTAEIPAFLLALACFTAGAIVAGLAMSLRMTKSHRQLSREHKRVVALQNELKGVQAQAPASLPSARTGT